MPTIVKGEDRTLTITLLESDGDPFDVSTATEIEAFFCPESGTVLLSRSLTGGQVTVVNGLNKIAIELDQAFTDTMRAEETGSFSVHTTIAGKKRIFQEDLKETLNVVAQMEC